MKQLRQFLVLLLVLVPGNLQPTPLHDAVAHGRFFKTRKLLAEGADVRVRDEDGNTPLHYAKSFVLAQLLFDHKAQVNAQNKYGITPLHVAVVRGKPSLVRKLLSMGAEVNLPDNHDVTPLHLATAISYLKNKSALINPMDPAESQVGASMAVGGAIASSIAVIGTSSFAHASGKWKSVAQIAGKELQNIARSANDTLKAAGGAYVKATELKAATRELYAKTAHELAKQTAEETTAGRVKTGVAYRSAAKTATRTAGIVAGVIALLLTGIVVVDIAVRNRVLGHLLRAGAKVNAQDSLGNTPLHILAGGSLLRPGDRRGGILMAQRLLSHGGSRTIENVEGRTPYAQARRNNRWLLMGLLKPKKTQRKLA